MYYSCKNIFFDAIEMKLKLFSNYELLKIKQINIYYLFINKLLFSLFAFT